MKIEYLNEIWRPAKYYYKDGRFIDLTGLYEVSNYGRVRSVDRTVIYPDGRKVLFSSKLMKQNNVKGGYLIVELSMQNRNTNRTIFYVHRLVAFAFPEICGEYFKGCEVNHLNEDPTCNIASNLRICTPKENNNYGNRISNALKTRDRNGKRNKPVLQYDLEGNFIKEWPSGTIAARVLGINQGKISDCCRGIRKSAGGYIWKFKEGD